MASNHNTLAIESALSTFAAAIGSTEDTMATTIVCFLNTLADYIPEIHADSRPELKEIVAIIKAQKAKAAQENPEGTPSF